MTTLVLEPFKLGDFIQSTALLMDLRRSRPGERVIVAASRPEVAEASRITGLADETILIGEERWRAGDASGLLAAPKIINLSSSPPSLKMVESLASQNLEVDDGHEFALAKPGHEGSEPDARIFESPSHQAANSKNPNPEAASQGKREILGPRLLNGELALPGLHKLAMALMAADRKLGTINLVDLWRNLGPSRLKSEGGLYWPRSNAAAISLANQGSRHLSSGAFFPLSNPSARPAPPEDDHDGVLKSLNGAGGPLVGLHLGCGHHSRRWPVERFAALARLLSPARTAILGGPSESSLAKRFLTLFKASSPETGSAPEPINLSGRTSLASLGRALEKLDLLVCADTSVMHMAAAVGTPVVAVFGGPAYAFETGPYATRALVVQGLGPCAPCRESAPCPYGRCQALPPVSPVAKAALASLGRKSEAAKAGGRRPADDFPPSNGGAESDQSSFTFQTLRTDRDPLGQILRPLGGASEAIPGRLAMALRAAGASVLGLADISDFQNALLDWPCGQSKLAADEDVIRRVAWLAFDDPGSRSKFAKLAAGLLTAPPSSAP